MPDRPYSPPPGLCETCVNVKVIDTRKGSRFYLCQLADVDPRFPKYPRIPVLRCRGFAPAGSGDSADSVDSSDSVDSIGANAVDSSAAAPDAVLAEPVAAESIAKPAVRSEDSER